MTEYQPPEKTAWRDVTGLRASERHDRLRTRVGLIAVLFPPCLAALTFACLGPGLGTIVVIVLMCWGYL